jgi:hypothetical protein
MESTAQCTMQHELTGTTNNLALNSCSSKCDVTALACSTFEIARKTIDYALWAYDTSTITASPHKHAGGEAVIVEAVDSYSELEVCDI